MIYSMPILCHYSGNMSAVVWNVDFECKENIKQSYSAVQMAVIKIHNIYLYRYNLIFRCWDDWVKNDNSIIVRYCLFYFCHYVYIFDIIIDHITLLNARIPFNWMLLLLSTCCIFSIWHSRPCQANLLNALMIKQQWWMSQLQELYMNSCWPQYHFVTETFAHIRLYDIWNVYKQSAVVKGRIIYKASNWIQRHIHYKSDDGKYHKSVTLGSICRDHCGISRQNRYLSRVWVDLTSDIAYS